jgi:hypothetical protein
MTNIEQLRYPTGRFAYDENVAINDHPMMVAALCDFPDKLQQRLIGVTPEKFNRTYRPGGWTAQQVIHHLYDSHTHAFMRFKWALTEENPSILPYNEEKFAHLADYNLPVEVAVQGLQVIHRKWHAILVHMVESDWQKTYFHTGYGQTFHLRYAMAMYVWHCSHHFAHIELCLKP